MKIPEKVNKYLRKKASGKWKLEWKRTDNIENIVVVPAIAEFNNIQNVLESLSKNEEHILDKTLILFVINNLNSSTGEVKSDNSESINFLSNLVLGDTPCLPSTSSISTTLKVGYIDASSDGNALDSKSGGVGLARKIGMDLALTAFNYSSNKKHIIISLDADCIVENNYLSAIINAFNKLNLNAATVEFSHTAISQSDSENILKYEIFLRYYVIGLLYAKSQFAFHTIGSAIACDSEAYLKVGGMNTRQAAEDFYFLQKLAKIYRIYKINSTIVKPSGRQSWRVPFGTGKSIMDFQNKRRQFLLHDSNIFIILKDWIELFNSDYALSTEILYQKAKAIHPELYNYLVQRDFPAKWEKILANCTSEKQLNHQKINWFDALNTLKLIHHLRDTSFPMQDADMALRNMLNLIGYDIEADSEIQLEKRDLRKYLNTLIKIENSFPNILLAENQSLNANDYKKR